MSEIKNGDIIVREMLSINKYSLGLAFSIANEDTIRSSSKRVTGGLAEMLRPMLLRGDREAKKLRDEIKARRENKK